MGSFFIGLGLLTLGFGFFQFSGMFNLYKAKPKETAPPWPYWVLRVAGYLLMGWGVILMAESLL